MKRMVHEGFETWFNDFRMALKMMFIIFITAISLHLIVSFSTIILRFRDKNSGKNSFFQKIRIFLLDTPTYVG